MENNSYTTVIQVSQPPQIVFNALTKKVSAWWGGNDLEGGSEKLDDEFIIHHPGAHYSKQKVVEWVQDKKVVWLVTDSTLYWLKGDQREWTGTKMIFEITTEGDKTVLRFMHDGLLPGKECYAMCEQGWTKVIKDWLFNFIMHDKPQFRIDRKPSQ